MQFDTLNYGNIMERVYLGNKEMADNPKFRLYQGEIFVPRVTVLLDTIKEDYLIQWANSLGWKRMSYSKTLQEYADIGTEVHNEIENFIKYGEEGISPGFMSFKEWWDRLNELNVITDIQSEVTMACPYFGGTTDLVFNANGKNCLVDFKTSKHITYKYIMQLAAYTYMMQTELNRPIDYCIIFQVDKYEPYIYQVYMYNLHDPTICSMFDMGLEYMMILSKGLYYKMYMEKAFAESEADAKTKVRGIVFK